MGLLMAAGWLSGAFGFVTGWAARARLHAVASDPTPVLRVRGRLRHGGVARRAVTLRCRHVRRGMRRIHPERIHHIRALVPR